MNKDLTGKRVLFFSPTFFGYEHRIVDKLIELGAEVDFYNVRSVESPIEKALLKVSPKIFSKKSHLYYEKIINANKDKNYDFVFIIKCDMTPEKILKRLRETFNQAKFYLYLWDSIKNIPGISEKFQYFDKVYSFDSKDCQDYSILNLRPLFFADEYCNQEVISSSESNYDICFLGTIHSDRYSIIKQVDDFCTKNHLSKYWFKFLQSKFIYYFYKFTKKDFLATKPSHFDFEKMTSSEIVSIVKQSKVVLDIEHPKQVGLTMRTIEMIGMNKKLLTTNQSIVEYDFYNPKNIQVLDRKNIVLDLEFFKEDYVPIDREIYERYSLKRWLLEILEVQ